MRLANLPLVLREIKLAIKGIAFFISFQTAYIFCEALL